MTDQQFWSLLGACVLVLVPLGAFLGSVVRWLRDRLLPLLPPRHLRRAGIRHRARPREEAP